MPANWDWRHWILSHLIWVVAICVGLFFGHIALQQHDARLAAEATIKTSEATIAGLKQQIAQTDAATNAKVQTIVKVVHDVQTPTQAIQAIPLLTEQPIDARPIPNDPANIQVAALPLVNALEQGKEAEVKLAGCQSDLKSEQSIEAQKDTEIAALKAKPKFWKRVTSRLKSLAWDALFVEGLKIALTKHP